MRKDRWRSLDWEPGAAENREPTGSSAPPNRQNGAARETRHRALAGLQPSRNPTVAAARGLYLLRNWQAVVDALLPETLPDPAAGGAWLLRGLALARLGDLDAASRALAAASRLAPADAFTGCAHAAFLLHRGQDAEAGAVLDSGVQVFGCSGVQEATGVRAFRHSGIQAVTAPTPEHPNTRTPEHLVRVAEQLRAACEWAEGQRQLQQGDAREAARCFAAAGRQFLAAAERLAVARQALPERLGAVYVGQVVSLLVEGHLETAQQLYGRLRPAGVRFARPLEQFARDLHELCRLLPQADPEQRLATAAPLTAVVADLRMRVALWDGSQPVTITWGR